MLTGPPPKFHGTRDNLGLAVAVDAVALDGSSPADTTSTGRPGRSGRVSPADTQPQTPAA